MKTYSAESKCDACGHGNISRVFRGVTTEGVDRSYMWRKCLGCGYTWREAPLYRAQEQGGHDLLISLDGVVISRVVLDVPIVVDL